MAQFAELKWWRNYLRDKNIADYLAWKKKYWQDLLDQCGIEKDKELRVLDAGCGPSGMFMMFAENDCVAFDPLIQEYEELPHFSSKDYPHVNFVKAGLEDFQTQKKFDLIFCMNAINHVRDIDKSMKNLGEWASSGSELVLSIDAHNFAFFKFLFRLLPGDILHPHQYDLKEYCRMIKEAGFSIEKEICLKKEFFFDYYVVVARKT